MSLMASTSAKKHSKYLLKTYEYGESSEKNEPEKPQLRTQFRTYSKFQEHSLGETKQYGLASQPSSSRACSAHTSSEGYTPKGATSGRVFFPPDEEEEAVANIPAVNVGQKLKASRTQRRAAEEKDRAEYETQFQFHQHEQEPEESIPLQDSSSPSSLTSSHFELTLPRKSKEEANRLKEKYQFVEKSRKPTPYQVRRERQEKGVTEIRDSVARTRSPQRPITPVHLMGESEKTSLDYSRMSLPEIRKWGGRPFGHVRTGRSAREEGSARDRSSRRRTSSEEEHWTIEQNSTESRPVATTQESPNRLAELVGFSYSAPEKPESDQEQRPISRFSLKGLHRSRSSSKGGQEQEFHTTGDGHGGEELMHTSYSERKHSDRYQQKGDQATDTLREPHESVRYIWARTTKKTGISMSELLASARMEAQERHNRALEEVIQMEQVDPSTYAPFKGSEAAQPATDRTTSDHFSFPEEETTYSVEFPSEELSKKKEDFIECTEEFQYEESKTKTPWGTPWVKIHMPNQGIMRILDSPDKKRTADDTQICSPYVASSAYMEYQQSVKRSQKRAAALLRWEMVRRVVLGPKYETTTHQEDTSSNLSTSYSTSKEGAERDITSMYDTETTLGDYAKHYTPLTSARTRRQRLERLVKEVEGGESKQPKPRKSLRPVRTIETQKHPRQAIQDYYFQLLGMSEKEYDRYWLRKSCKNESESANTSITGYQGNPLTTRYEKPRTNPPQETLGKDAVSLIDMRRRLGLSTYAHMGQYQ
eukprot:gb/GECG01011666.1/.p1 GENE.gb/GECG01011666.1/~~gb/GECG01011666.1/.p1  ORF type:complete len:763 (+),score=94.94 gb/GECG01011666.1/:1-2289(+)